jgi:uncharacterized membrane protein YfcA
MIFGLAVELGLAIMIMAFLAEYVDSTLGMGYGTTLTPLLLALGFEPMQIVPSVLLSELITGLLAGFTHHEMGNVNFKPKTTNVSEVIQRLSNLGYVETFKQDVPLALKITLLIASCSIFGTVAAVLVAINLPKFYLKLYIGLLVLVIGVVIMATLNKTYAFSWGKITALSVIASFNKGMSGGGYGPVVTGGQLLSGVDEKNAIGITSLAEGLTCVVGVFLYYLLKSPIDWTLAPYLLIGAVPSAPLSAYTVKRVHARSLRQLIGVITIMLGIYTLANLFLDSWIGMATAILLGALALSRIILV